jgi:hypothetical protein
MKLTLCREQRNQRLATKRKKNQRLATKRKKKSTTGKKRKKEKKINDCGPIFITYEPIRLLCQPSSKTQKYSILIKNR